MLDFLCECSPIPESVFFKNETQENIVKASRVKSVAVICDFFCIDNKISYFSLFPELQLWIKYLTKFKNIKKT